jgi:Rieske Fe-S protein
VSELGDQRSPLQTPATTRRTVLGTAGLLALASAGAAALAGCSAEAESGSATPTVPATPPNTSAPASPSPAADATSPKPSASKAKAPNGPSVATSKVPVGGVILEDADYVVTQPNKGSYKAFSKICTHQGCPVAEVRNEVIHCNCHGSEYSIKDGSVTNPPASKPLATAKTTVFEGKVYVTG